MSVGKHSILVVGERVAWRKITFRQRRINEFLFRYKTCWHLQFLSRGLDPRGQEVIDSVPIAKLALAPEGRSYAYGS
jgi:hypothetical protein